MELMVKFKSYVIKQGSCVNMLKKWNKNNVDKSIPNKWKSM